MKRWWLVIALLLSLGINIGLLAGRAFQPRPAEVEDVEDPVDDGRVEMPAMPREGRLPPVVHRMADELGLEGAKRDAFVEIQRTFFEQTLTARRRMVQVQGRVRDEITSGEPDREALDALLIELSDAHTALERAFVTNLLDTRELLDPGQERRYMRFLRHMRQVRSEVEKRFRERWRGRGEWQGPDGPRRPFGPGRRPGGLGRRPGGPPPEAAPPPPQEPPG